MVDHCGADVENRHGYSVGSGQTQPDERIVQRKRLQSLLRIVVVAKCLVLIAKVEAWPDHGHASHLACAQHAAILQIAQRLFDGEIRKNTRIERDSPIMQQPRPPVKDRRWIGNPIRLDKPLGFLAALRQGLHLLNDSQEIVVDEHACLGGGFRINSLAA